MAKGTLVFEFESALDLENQMRAYLRLPQLKEVMLKEAEKAPDMARGVLGKPGDGMTFSESSLTAPPMAGKTASGITEEVRKLNQEAAAVVLSAAAEALVGAVAPVAEKVETVPAPEQNVPALTLETLADAPYPDLLAFCEHTPAVGVDVSKCQAAFFRKLVEMKIKAFLETK
jgi:hypothetical protein